MTARDTETTEIKNRADNMVINNSVSDAENYIELIKNTLSEYRFHHSMCVAEKARELAVKYKLDADKAYLAGVLHDVTKDAKSTNQTCVYR